MQTSTATAGLFSQSMQSTRQSVSHGIQNLQAEQRQQAEAAQEIQQNEQERRQNLNEAKGRYIDVFS